MFITNVYILQIILIVVIFYYFWESTYSVFQKNNHM